MKVEELMPGMKIGLAGMEATFIARTQHPIWLGLQLVIWKMPESSPVGEWSFDALDIRQDVGEALPFTRQGLIENLREALLGGE